MCPRLIVCVGSGTCARMHPFMHVGAGFHLEPAQGIQHHLGHLGRCRIVQIVELRIGESRKFALQSGDIERGVGQSRSHDAGSFQFNILTMPEVTAIPIDLHQTEPARLLARSPRTSERITRRGN